MQANFHSSHPATSSPGKADSESVISPTPLSRTLPLSSDIHSYVLFRDCQLSSRVIIMDSRSEAEITSSPVRLNREPSFLETRPTSANLSIGLKQDTMSTDGNDRASVEVAASILISSPTTHKEIPITLNPSLDDNINSCITEQSTKKEACTQSPASAIEDLIRTLLEQDDTYRQKEIKSIRDNSKYWSIAFTDGDCCCICNLSESPSVSALCLTICTDSRGINRHFKTAKHIGDRKAHHCTHPTHPCKAAFSRRDALTRHLKDVQHPRLTARRKKSSSAGSKGRKVDTRGGPPRSLK